MSRSADIFGAIRMVWPVVVCVLTGVSMKCYAEMILDLGSALSQRESVGIFGSYLDPISIIYGRGGREAPHTLTPKSTEILLIQNSD